MIYDFDKMMVDGNYIGKCPHKEGVYASLAEDHVDIAIFFSDPTDVEIQDIRAGELMIGATVCEKLLVFLFKFGSQNWIDAIYDYHIEPIPEELVYLFDKPGYVFNFVLVDYKTRQVKVLRSCTLNRKCSLEVLDLFIEHKLTMTPTSSAHYESVNAILTQHPTNDLVKTARFICEIEE